MVRAIMLDMPDGLFQPVHCLHRDDGVEIFGLPVFFGGGLGGGKDRAHRLIAADFAAGFRQVFQNRQAVGFQNRAIQQQEFPPRRRSRCAASWRSSVMLARHLPGRPWHGHRHGKALPDAPAPARAPHCITRPVRPLPPRGMIRSTAPFRPSSIRPTAARSVILHILYGGFRQARRLQSVGHGLHGSRWTNGWNPNRRAGWRHCRT